MPFDSQTPIQTPLQWQHAYQSGDKHVADFHATPCWEWPEAQDRAPLTRQELEDWKNFLQPFASSPDLLLPIDELGSPGARVVATGQQAGAGLSPTLMIYKAFAAEYWAKRYTRDHQTTCVPVFWIASEDHDLAEVENVAWLASDGERRAFSLAPDSAERTKSVSDQRIDEEKAEGFLRQLAETTYETEFRPAIFELLKESFADDATFESHFLHLFCRWLLPMGIVPVVPRLGFIRRRAASLIQQEIDNSLDSTRLIQQQSDAMTKLGINPPLHRSGNELNFFLFVDGHRGKVILEKDTIVVHKTDESKEELLRIDKNNLQEILNDAPERFSPNAALRPLVQDLIFPTVAYIAGPTELVYHAQIGLLYDHFNVPRPAVFPRPNVVLLDTKTEKGLKKLGLDESAACAANEEDFLEHCKKAQANDQGNREFKDKVRSFKEATTQLDEWIRDFTPDTGVRKAAEKLKKSSDTGVEKLAERFESYLANRDADAVRAREKVQAILFPEGISQERSVGALSPLLIQYGPDMLQRLYKAIDYEAHGFQSISLKSLTK